MNKQLIVKSEKICLSWKYIIFLPFFPLYPEPCPIVESSIEEPVLGDITLENPNNHHVTFQLVEEGSKRRKTKLVDSLGYSYNVRSKRSYATYWQCVVRPRENACKATVIQRDGNFHSGENAHNHTAEVGAMTAAKIVNLVKEKALEDKFKPASAIVEEVYKLHLTDSQVKVANISGVGYSNNCTAVIHYSLCVSFNYCRKQTTFLKDMFLEQQEYDL